MSQGTQDGRDRDVPPVGRGVPPEGGREPLENDPAYRAGVADALRHDEAVRQDAARHDGETRVLHQDDTRRDDDRDRRDSRHDRHDSGDDRGADDRADGGSRLDAVPGDRRALREEIVERERERFGGFKFGSAFFGWLAAMGTAVLLTALAAAIGAGVSWGTGTSVGEAGEAATDNPTGASILGAIVLAVLLFVSYFAGGYVAGRMARFNGAKQGLAVWLWAIVVAVVVAVVTAIAGSQWDILAMFNGFPRIPVTPETATTTGILTAVGAAIVTLVGAVLGGMTGMRYHRKVDRVGLGG
ncbi:hypothetical protein [Microbacterium sp. Marseille-Q6965]|uniref:hypothetical protein n=1 Tax=Microbacterium sp. Marseille-Q6965 TaxID=2965072 RepID=UPI0021B76140|nr:hypothetical protein [Microbacterium sp. Marseille-Q6965]